MVCLMAQTADYKLQVAIVDLSRDLKTLLRVEQKESSKGIKTPRS